MRFAAPALLLLLVIPVGMLVAYLLLEARRTRYALQFSNLDLLDEIAPATPGWRRHLAAGLVLLAVALNIVALARPLEEVEVPVEASTVVLALDVSISMDARDVEPRRLDAAQQAALRFLDEVEPTVRVGVVTFAETAIGNIGPTNDRAQAREVIENLRLRPGTAIGDALVTAVEMVKTDLAVIQAQTPDDEAVPATIILLSDGDTTAGEPDSVGIQVAQDAGISVNTISFGTEQGVIRFQGQLVEVPVNGRALRRIARQTDGEFYDAESAAALTEVFETLGVAVGVTTEEVENTVPWVAAGLVALVGAGIGSLVWFGRLP